VTKLEQDLVAARADLRTANRQFSEATNKLQEVTDEVTWLRDDNSKLAQDVDGERALMFQVATSSAFIRSSWC
jgi:predicted  nucleic acid-binding Zn-ribbon protein